MPSAGFEPIVPESKAVADPRLRLRGLWGQQTVNYSQKYYLFILWYA